MWRRAIKAGWWESHVDGVHVWHCGNGWFDRKIGFQCFPAGGPGLLSVLRSCRHGDYDNRFASTHGALDQAVHGSGGSMYTHTVDPFPCLRIWVRECSLRNVRVLHSLLFPVRPRKSYWEMNGPWWFHVALSGQRLWCAAYNPINKSTIVLKLN